MRTEEIFEDHFAQPEPDVSDVNNTVFSEYFWNKSVFNDDPDPAPIILEPQYPLVPRCDFFCVKEPSLIPDEK